MCARDSLSLEQRFVEITYLMIRNGGIENLSTREISKRVNCSPGTLYKHFEDLDHLLLIAEMRFLEGYTNDLAVIERSTESSLQKYIDAWVAFNRYAFANPPIFLHLFWDMDNDSFVEAVTEYFRLFPQERGRNDDTFFGFFYSVIYSGDLEARSLAQIRHAVADGEIPFDEADYLSSVNVLITEGLLRKHLKDYRDPGVAEAAAAHCDELILQTIEKSKTHNLT